MNKVWLVLVIIALLYLLVGLLIYFFQEKIIFHPQSGAIPPPEDLNISEVYIPAANQIMLHAWYMPVDSAKKTILFFHGNAGNVSRGEKRMRFFKEIGYNVMAVEYRGFGVSSGKINNEADLYTDAQRCYDFLKSNYQLPDSAIVVWGWSLGGSVAADLAQYKPCHALVLEGTFSSIEAMAGKKFWLVPYKYLIRYDFATIDKINNSHCPLLVIHSKDDNTIPIVHGRNIYDCFNGQKKFIEIGGDHNHSFIESEEKLIPEVINYIENQ